jgi:hypothetical protein
LELDELTPGMLTPLVGQRFALATGQGGPEVSLELVLVQPLRPHSRRAEPFSLHFRGPRLPLLPQSIYAVAHPELGELALFLVPVEGGPDSVTYEAVFN